MRALNKKELKERLLYKRIVQWNRDSLVLDDGTIITLETTDYDCCAGAYGHFKNVTLDAVITDVQVGVEEEIPDDDTRVCRNTITIFHNQNPIALAEMTADSGNGGYYYSVGSMVIGDCYFPFVSA